MARLRLPKSKPVHALHLKEGELVWLKPFEGEPRQQAKLLQDVNPGDDVVMVEITKEYRDKHDDGLRELDPDQIEGRA
jgi:hypothetical protein